MSICAAQKVSPASPDLSQNGGILFLNLIEAGLGGFLASFVAQRDVSGFCLHAHVLAQQNSREYRRDLDDPPFAGGWETSKDGQGRFQYTSRVQ